MVMVVSSSTARIEEQKIRNSKREKERLTNPLKILSMKSFYLFIA
jgi:hypothetical protein